MVVSMLTCDFLVVGAGIAGTSMAAQLAETHSVLLVDMEERAGYHSTSRSAASYEPNYGPVPMLALTRASHDFFMEAPRGFADVPLFTPRGSLFLEADGQADKTAALLSKSKGLTELSTARTCELFPVLKPDYAKRCFLDSQTGDLDVDLLHRGYLRMLKERGGKLLLSSPLQSAEYTSGAWKVRSGSTEVIAKVVVNAGGAWGDVVAKLCGATPVGLVPKRRSIGVVPMPPDLEFAHWPMVTDVGETWYAKPQSGKLIVSSADATAVEPHDAYADDMAIAEGIDRMMTATTIEVERLDHNWGGLRTFAPDGSPVVGFDAHTEGFFWLAGQGGYGIQSAPGLSATAAAMARRLPISQVIIDMGLNPADIAPERFSA
jgi:D-arginine dehydrogenase